MNIPKPTPRISVNKTSIPTSCDPDVPGDDVGDRDASCQLIGPGSIFGDFEVINGGSSIGGALGNRASCLDLVDGKGEHRRGYRCVPESETRLRSLTLEYRGDDCDLTSSGQSHKVRCRNRGLLPEVAQIRIRGGGDDYFDDSHVTVGSEIVLTPPDPDSSLPDDCRVRIENSQGKLIQVLRFHTSCSEPLGPGDQFGSLRVKSLVTQPK